MNWFKKSIIHFLKKNNMSAIDEQKLPQHVAIIMDGNGRWARQRGLPRFMGHRAGVEALRKIIQMSSKIKIKVLTLYAFSTENWKRPTDEVNTLMSLLVEYLQKELLKLHENHVRIFIIGNIDAFPDYAKREICHAVLMTENNKGLIVNIALNYGGRSEIVQAVKNIAEKVLTSKILIENIDELMFRSELYTHTLPDPDLVIRTSGEHRISNFLLFQIAYSELYFTEVYWPDFDEKTFTKALINYQNRNRRFGDISDTGRKDKFAEQKNS